MSLASDAKMPFGSTSESKGWDDVADAEVELMKYLFEQVIVGSPQKFPGNQLFEASPFTSFASIEWMKQRFSIAILNL